MWFLNNNVLLTKDNLARRNWTGCTKCCFCGAQETVEHLFISCPFARLLWRIVNITYDLPPPTNTTNMFGNWLNGVDRISKARIRIGVSALCWSIWRCRNDIMFNRNKTSNLLQVIHMVAHWIQLWAYLLPPDQRDIMATGCNRLLMVAQDIFSRVGRQHSRRLQDA